MAFTSDLSTSDFWLLSNSGYIPVAVVVGNSVYSMGAIGELSTGIKGAVGGELGSITKLMYNARAMALGRMQAEAEKLGADGVIGVKLEIKYFHSDEWMEITAVGTAVKRTGGERKSQSLNGPTVVIPATGAYPELNIK